MGLSAPRKAQRDSKGRKKLGTYVLELEGRESRHRNSSLETEDTEGQNARLSAEPGAGALDGEGASQQVLREDARCTGRKSLCRWESPTPYVRLCIRRSNQNRWIHKCEPGS